MATSMQALTGDDLFRPPASTTKPPEPVAEERPTPGCLGAEEGRVAARVISSLQAHATAWRLGGVYSSATGFQLSRTGDVVRASDAAFVSRERMQSVGRVFGYWPGAPDLAVEVISPDDLYLDVEEKVDTWLQHSTRMVIVLNPRRRTAVVYRSGAPPQVLSAQHVLGGEDVVPGWSVPLTEIFADEFGA